jgi:tyrosyl-tRNA synthetase
MNLLDELEFRELIYQNTDRDGLDKRLSEGPITLYIGFDPTADSLHIGNLLQILLLHRFQLAGHRPIAVVGTGTGLVGDPSGKKSERKLNPEQIVEEWAVNIRLQLERFLDFDSQSNPARIVSNYEWLGELELISFLRDIGKHFPIGLMLAKDSVKSRLEEGISYTEFSYMILQAYDFLRLYELYGCQLQAGGSDQWGNITAGIDLIRRKLAEPAYGLTLPLVTSADGVKLGKTEVGAIWLDVERTTPYQFYQYWINVADQDVLKFLKQFTFLDREALIELEREVANTPSERVAQRTLAREVTRYVHGHEAMESAEKISQSLFYGRISDLAAEEIEQALYDVPSHLIRGKDEIILVDLLFEANIASSKRRAREDIQNGAITVNDKKVKERNTRLTLADRIANKYIVIRRGKTRYFLVDWSE